ncbi:MAG: HemK2/MTQ2 family protein methyltransferase [Candidatus Hadarchaeota archaeon]
MKVEIRLFSNLRELAGQKSVHEEVPEGATVEDAVKKLAGRLGKEFQGRVIDEAGHLRKMFSILVNEQLIARLDGPLTKLEEGDVISIFPPVAGGMGKAVLYKNMKFSVHPEVYEPADDTLILAKNLETQAGEKVLELGTGCGMLAIMAAKGGAKTVATDINPSAIECARGNAAAHGVADRIDFRLGDLFEPVAGERFDLILFNPPYLPVGPGEEIGGRLDRAWEAGPDGRLVIDRFLRELPDHLEKNGRAMFVQSSLSNIFKTLEVLKEMGFHARIMREKFSFEELYLITAAKNMDKIALREVASPKHSVGENWNE